MRARARPETRAKSSAKGKPSFTLKDLKNDSSSVVLPKPASPTTIRLNDSRGGSRESRGSMLRLWYGSRGGDPIEFARALASRNRRYSSPMTPEQCIVGYRRSQGLGGGDRGGVPSATNPSGPAVFSSSRVMPPQGEGGEPQSSLFAQSAQSSAVRLVKDCPRSEYDPCVRTLPRSSSCTGYAILPKPVVAPPTS